MWHWLCLLDLQFCTLYYEFSHAQRFWAKFPYTTAPVTVILVFKYEGSVPTELLSKVLNVSQVCDSCQECHLDHSDKSKDLKLLLKTNNVTNTNNMDHFSQENQDYYNQYDQQFIAHKHDGGQEYYNRSD